MVPAELVKSMDCEHQGPEAVARSVAILMADERRQGQLIYSVGGRFMEIEESKFLPVGREIVGENDEDTVIQKLHKVRADLGYS